METGITLEYLTALHKAYETFIHDISRVIPVIRVDYSRFQTAEAMAKMIKREYQELTNIRTVHWNEDGTSSSPNSSPAPAPSN